MKIPYPNIKISRITAPLTSGIIPKTHHVAVA
jgi:hypothetical protein